MARRTILLTGGAGFIGHHFVEHFYKNFDTNPKIKIIDRLTYAGSLHRLRDIHVWPSLDVEFYAADFTQPLGKTLLEEIGNVTDIIHMGAETHVDNSIEDPEAFVQANIFGTFQMLEMLRKMERKPRFFYFSTDEVFGPCYEGTNPYDEYATFNPSNPYSATKAAGEMLCMAYRNTYKLDIVITRTMNVIGERQHHEKFIPKVIRSILTGEEITIHADSTGTIPGSRQYIHARNVADAYVRLIEEPELASTAYHIVGEREVSNLEVVELISGQLGIQAKYKLVDFHSSRPGHDLRYALDGSWIKKELGWEPPKTFEQSLEKTVRWYLENRVWLGL